MGNPRPESKKSGNKKGEGKKQGREKGWVFVCQTLSNMYYIDRGSPFPPPPASYMLTYVPNHIKPSSEG